MEQSQRGHNILCLLPGNIQYYNVLYSLLPIVRGSVVLGAGNKYRSEE
jgi:hypothetical protein